MNRRAPLSALLLAGLVTLAACSGTALDAPDKRYGQVDAARMARAASEPQNWLVDGGTYGGWHYSPLKQIDTASVARLRPAWFFELDTTRGQEAEPVVVDGVMYLSTAWSKVYALDAVTGNLLWRFDPQVSGLAGAQGCCDVVNRGVAVFGGRVFVAALDGRLIALDASNGRVVWSVPTFAAGGPYTITAAPRVVRDKVIIGNAGGEFGARGYISAYNIADGRMAWRFYLVPGDPAKGPDGAASDEVLARLARPTWHGEWYRYGGGGTAWNTIAYDPQLNQLLVGTGNGSPWNRRLRSDGRGDNLFLCSILALDVDTGRYRWHYQINPGESWDYSAVMPIVQADLRIGGALRKVLLQAPKNGFFYVIDRSNGQLISAEPYVEGITWASRIDRASGRPVEAANAHYEQGPFNLSPSPSGAHNWHPMAFSPDTGWVYFSAAENSATMQGDARLDPLPVPVDTIGVQMRPAPTTRRYLQAWDPIANRRVWRVDQPPALQAGGTLATAGGLLFQGIGGVTGELVAYRADTGARAWSHHLPNAPQATPVSYSIGGRQYIAVLTGARGAGSAAGGPQAYARQFGRVAVFALDGTAATPPDPPAAAPANPPAETFAPEAIAMGERVYGRLCMRCHGPETQSSNVVPDLRRAAALGDAALWRAIVVDGALTPNGMVGWGHVLTPTEAEAVRAYVAGQAHKLARGEAMAIPTASH